MAIHRCRRFDPIEFHRYVIGAMELSESIAYHEHVDSCVNCKCLYSASWDVLSDQALYESDLTRLARVRERLRDYAAKESKRHAAIIKEQLEQRQQRGEIHAGSVPRSVPSWLFRAWSSMRAVVQRWAA